MKQLILIIRGAALRIGMGLIMRIDKSTIVLRHEAGVFIIIPEAHPLHT